MPSLLIPEIVPYIGYLFHIFWMSMMFPKPKPNFQTLFSLLNILLIDNYRLHIYNHLTNAHYMLEKRTGRRNIPGSVQMSSKPRENHLRRPASSR